MNAQAQTIQATPAKKTLRTKRGVVVRVSGPTTAVVEVTVLLSHPKYFKRYSRSKRFHAHIGTGGTVTVGQQVTIVEARPFSRLKRWRIAAADLKTVQPATTEEAKA